MRGNSGKNPTARARRFRWVLLLVVASIVTGCSTGSIAVRYLYGRFDNSLNKQLLAFAEFNSEQEAEIRSAVDNFVAWHRRNELPRYASFLEQLIQRLEAGEFDRSVILADLQQLRKYADYAYVKSPISMAPQFLQSTSDQQVQQITQYFAERELAFLEDQAERDKAGRQRGVAATIKNVERLGFKLRPEQKEMIATGMAKYRWNPRARRQLWLDWEKDFIALLRQRRRQGFHGLVAGHLENYQKLARLNDPQLDSYNQATSADTIYQVVSSLDPAQKQALIRRLDTTRLTLLALAKN